MASSSSPSSPRIVSPEEMLPDGFEILSFVIPGRPATKKTSQRVVRRGGVTKILPSVQYERYESHSRPYIEAVWRNLGREPMDFGVSLELKVYIDSWVIGDTVGFAQAAFDLLQEHGVITNDIWISWQSCADGHMVNIDKEHPRAELVIRRFRHPKEMYRAKQEVKEQLRQEKAAARAAR